MNNILLLLSAVATIATTAIHVASAQPASGPSSPQLVVLLAVDQFSATLFDTWRSRYSGGLKRTVDEGIIYPKAYAATCKMVGSFDLRAKLPQVAVPTAVIVGEEDYATPVAMAQLLHRGIFKSSLTVLPGARHLTPLEQPQAIAAEFERLLQAQRI
jgi:pimeloyl-ACP methyl ester carboxylesterase